MRKSPEHELREKGWSEHGLGHPDGRREHGIHVPSEEIGNRPRGSYPDHWPVIVYHDSDSGWHAYAVRNGEYETLEGTCYVEHDIRGTQQEDVDLALKVACDFAKENDVRVRFIPSLRHLP